MFLFAKLHVDCVHPLLSLLLLQMMVSLYPVPVLLPANSWWLYVYIHTNIHFKKSISRLLKLAEVWKVTSVVVNITPAFIFVFYGFAV